LTMPRVNSYVEELGDADMLRSVVTALALVAGTWGSAAHAQTLRDSGGGTAGGGEAMPTLILPHELTSPLTSGPAPDGDAAANAPAGAATPATTEEVPYSVEGEETLDPGGN
jgi:hypothetical protein